MDPSKVPSPLINKPVPQFSLQRLDDTNKFVTQQDFQGHVTLLNVWATWCYSCAVEHAFLLELAKDKQFKIIGLDYKDDNAAANKWLQEHGNPYELVAIDPNGQAAIDWGVYGTPESFIVDKHGIIRYKQIGPINQDIWVNQIKPIVDKLEQAA